MVMQRKDLKSLPGCGEEGFGEEQMFGEPGSEVTEDEDVSRVLSSRKDESEKKEEDKLGKPHRGHSKELSAAAW